MQRLYENHKVLNVSRGRIPATLSADILPTLTERLQSLRRGAVPRSGRTAWHESPLPEKPFFVNDAKVSDHHAIIPTEQFVDLDAHDGGRATDL